MSSQLPPPGWYRDPEIRGQLRYWDGGRWTEDVAPTGEQAGQSFGRQPSAETGQPSAHGHLAAGEESDELLVFLFVDRVAGDTQWRDVFRSRSRMPVRAPMGGVVSDETTVACLLLAVAIRRLRADGIVELSAYDKSRFARSPERRVWARRALSASAVSPLAGRVLERLGEAGSEGCDVRDLVPSLPSESPQRPILTTLEEEAAARGLAEIEDTTQTRGWRGVREFKPDRERIATLEPEFGRAWAEWESFSRNEAELTELLLAELRRGLREYVLSARRSQSS